MGNGWGVVSHAGYGGNFSGVTLRNSTSKISRFTGQPTKLPRGYTYFYYTTLCIHIYIHAHTPNTYILSHIYTYLHTRMLITIYLYIFSRSYPLCYLEGPIMGLGQLNLRNSNGLALFGAKFGLDGAILCVHLFLDRKDLSLALLLNIGAGGLGKRVRSLKSLRIIFHLSIRISCIVGLH